MILLIIQDNINNRNEIEMKIVILIVNIRILLIEIISIMINDKNHKKD